MHRVCLTWDKSLNWEEQKLEAVSQLRQKSQSRGTGQSLKGRFSLGEIEEGFNYNFPKVHIQEAIQEGTLGECYKNPSFGRRGHTHIQHSSLLILFHSLGRKSREKSWSQDWRDDFKPRQKSFYSSSLELIPCDGFVYCYCFVSFYFYR